MAYIKYYRLETVEGKPLIESHSLDTLRAERDNPQTNMPDDCKIYSFDIDEEHSDPTQRMINKTFVE